MITEKGECHENAKQTNEAYRNGAGFGCSRGDLDSLTAKMCLIPNLSAGANLRLSSERNQLIEYCLQTIKVDRL